MLTNDELNHYDNRIDEIEQLLDLCDETYDYDVIVNLQIELKQIIDLLEKETKDFVRSTKLRLVK